MREHPHSSQQCINFLPHEDNLKLLLPDSIVTANSLHATSQTEKINESLTPHHRLYDMGLRTEYQSPDTKTLTAVHLLRRSVSV
ncbi:hypothetical protein TNCV_887851 [Trichonephila clavipes]|nr:hypothetical protein TNCV_887851 [Trichonephila clavipes]